MDAYALWRFEVGQANLAAALVAEHKRLVLASALDHGLPLLLMSVGAKNRREGRHLHLALIEELLEQFLELCARRSVLVRVI